MNIQKVIRELRTFMNASGYTEAALARQTGIPQPTIHRALKNPVRLTQTHRRLCKFADIELGEMPSSPETKDELIQEVLDIWDGTREHAHSLARLLRAAATLQAYGASHASRDRKPNHADR